MCVKNLKIEPQQRAQFNANVQTSKRSAKRTKQTICRSNKQSEREREREREREKDANLPATSDNATHFCF